MSTQIPPPTTVTPAEPSLADRALALMVMLGSDHAEVADTLFVKGCFGAKVDSAHCPIAVYLSRELDVPVYVAGNEVTIQYGPVAVADAYRVRTPPAVNEFVYQFDASRYPRLVARGGDGMTPEQMTALTNQVLVRFEQELADAGPEQLEHLARRAEGCYCTDLGRRERELVDFERARRAVTAGIEVTR